MILWLAAGCGPSEIKSVPSEPTVKFEADPGGAQQVVWTDLEDLFPERAAALPLSLSGLVPGLNGAQARAILDAAHQPGAKIFGQPGEASMGLGSILKDHSNVGATLILDLDATELHEVDLSLPQDVALQLLRARWGEATSVEHLDGTRAIYRWQPAGSVWWAELQPQPFAPVAPGIPGVAPKKALLRYLQPSSAPSPAPASH